LNTFIFNSDVSLAETIFHELAHQRVFASGDTDFNEAFATEVGEEGARRWLQSVGDAALSEKYLQALERKDDFVELIKRTRGKLQGVYEMKAGADEASDSRKREQKAKVIREMREEYAQLKSKWGGYTGYDKWFRGPLNNAQLNTVATYYDLVPAFDALLKANGGDFQKFYREAERLSKLPKEERRRQLIAAGSRASRRKI